MRRVLVLAPLVFPVLGACDDPCASFTGDGSVTFLAEEDGANVWSGEATALDDRDQATHYDLTFRMPLDSFVTTETGFTHDSLQEWTATDGPLPSFGATGHDVATFDRNTITAVETAAIEPEGWLDSVIVVRLGVATTQFEGSFCDP